MGKQFVCRLADIPANGMKECKAEGGLALLVANSGKEYFAYQAMCPHQEVALCEGLYDGSILTCHMHLWQWDLRSGSPIGLAEAPLEKFDLSVEGESVYVESKSAIDVGELFAGASHATLDAPLHSRSAKNMRRRRSCTRSVTRRTTSSFSNRGASNSRSEDERTSPAGSCSARARCSDRRRCSQLSPPIASALATRDRVC